MPTDTTSYRHRLPEVIRSSDRTYLRGLAALSRTTSALPDTLKLSDSDSDSLQKCDNYKSLKYKSRSFVGESFQEIRADSKKRHGSGSSAISSISSLSASSCSSGASTSSSSSFPSSRLPVLTSDYPQQRLSLPSNISVRHNRTSSPTKSAKSSPTRKSPPEDEADKLVGSLLSSPKWSRIKNSFESSQQDDKSRNNFPFPTISRSTSSLPFPTKEINFSKMTVAQVETSSCKSESTETKKANRTNSLEETFSDKVKDSLKKSKTDEESTSLCNLKEAQRRQRDERLQELRSKVRQNATAFSKDTNETDYKGYYGRLPLDYRSGTRVAVSRVRKTSTPGLSLRLGGAEIDLKIEKGLEGSLTSAKDVRSAGLTTSRIKLTQEIITSDTKDSVISTVEITNQQTKRPFPASFPSSRVSEHQLPVSRQLVKPSNKINMTNGDEAKISEPLSAPITFQETNKFSNEIKPSFSSSRQLVSRSNSFQHSPRKDEAKIEITPFMRYELASPRNLIPTSLNLSPAGANNSWKMTNSGSWIKVEKELAERNDISSVAILKGQFQRLEANSEGVTYGTEIVRKAQLEVSSLPAKSKCLSLGKVNKKAKDEITAPGLKIGQTDVRVKENATTIPPLKSIGKEGFVVREKLVQEELDLVNKSSIDQKTRNRKLSIVQQVVQNFEEHLASSSDSGSSVESTPTPTGIHQTSPYSFRSKSKIQESRRVQRDSVNSQESNGGALDVFKRPLDISRLRTSGRNFADNNGKIHPKTRSAPTKSDSSKIKPNRRGFVSKERLGQQKPDLPPPRKPSLTSRKSEVTSSPRISSSSKVSGLTDENGSLLAELEEWLTQKYDRKDSTSSLGSIVLPNQSFLWNKLAPRLSSGSDETDFSRHNNTPQMDGGEQRAPESYYSIPFSQERKNHNEHIYTEASFSKPNGTCYESDEGWVDVSDGELDKSSEARRNYSGPRYRLRTKSVSSNNSGRRSWRESAHELSTSKTLKPSYSTSNQREDMAVWESDDGDDDSSLSSASDHLYEALYDVISDKDKLIGQHYKVASKETNECNLPNISSISLDTGIDEVSYIPTSSSSSSGKGSTLEPMVLDGTGDDKASEVTPNSQNHNSDNKDINGSQLKRNWSLTKSDIQLELTSKLNKIKVRKNVHSSTDIGLGVKQEEAASTVSSTTTSKKKTLIKFILRQKGNGVAGTVGAPGATSSVGNNKKARSNKKGSMFYVKWSMVDRESRKKYDKTPEVDTKPDPRVESASSDSKKEQDQAHKLVINAQKEAETKRRPSSGSGLRRPSSPPPLPPIVSSHGGTKVVRSHSGSKSLEILRRPPLSQLAEDKTKSLEILMQHSEEDDSQKNGSALSSSNHRKTPMPRPREDIQSETFNSDSNVRVSSSSSSSRVTGESIYSLSAKCRSSIASSQSSHSAGSSYIHEDDLASIPKPTTLNLIGDDETSLCSYLQINGDPEDPLRSPFEEEPLYQFYHKDAKQRAVVWRSLQEQCENDHYDLDDDDFDVTDESNGLPSPTEEDSERIKTQKTVDPISPKIIPSAMDLLQQEGGGGQRTLWCEVPEVQNSGILDQISSHDRKIQEAMFEVITSEASYLKSLNILIEHFMQCPEFSDDFSMTCVLGRRERHVLFSDVIPVRDVSIRLLADLERRWQENILLSNICDILYEHASKFFNVYVKYCANQVYQDRILKELKATRPDFIEVLQRLESNPMCQGLDMHSFLMLPMQRITRMPLLVDAIFHRLTPESPYHSICKLTLASLNKLVAECNEGARKMERMEEMLVISRQLDFRDCKSIPLISASRWLVKRGELVRFVFVDPLNSRRTFGRSSRHSKTTLYLFLFTDLLVVTRRKNDENYVVLDYCPRNMVQVFHLEESKIPIPGKLPDGYKNFFQMTMLQNHEFKTIDMFLSCPLESDRTRWMEAVTPPISENPDEKIYEEWDCPQVQCIYPYYAQQPDELALDESDVVNVLRKMPDGWFEGERMRDGARGWFPSSFSVEIISSHIRARNLRQRYRLLMLSQAYVEEQRKIFMAQSKSK